MIGTGAGKVEGLTGASKFGRSSVIFSTAFVPSQELTTLRDVGDEVPAAILSNMLRASLALRRRRAKERVVQPILLALFMVDIIPIRVISDAWFLDLEEIAVLTIFGECVWPFLKESKQ